MPPSVKARLKATVEEEEQQQARTAEDVVEEEEEEACAATATAATTATAAAAAAVVARSVLVRLATAMVAHAAASARCAVERGATKLYCEEKAHLKSTIATAVRCTPEAKNKNKNSIY